jgi:fatty-acyl-CoA synthase
MTTPLSPTSPAFLHLQARRGAPGGIVFEGHRRSYAEIAAAVDALAAWLSARGVGPGQRIGVVAANEPALVASAFALWGLGAVVVPIGVRATANEVARCLAHAGASGLLVDAPREGLGRAAATAASIPAWACSADLPLAPRVLRRGGARSSHRRSGVAAIAYTSGTTGAPKGATLTHENLLWATLACAQARGDRPETVGACLSPLTHTPVLVSHLFCRILVGATAVLFERFDLGAVLEGVERFGITDLPLIGSMAFDVVGLGAVPARVRDTVKKVSVGGAPTPLEAKLALAEIFPGAEVIEAYGQTESTDGVTMARGRSVLDRPGTVGRTNPYVAVAIARPDGGLAAPDEEGEIVIGGPTVMAGYHRDPDTTAGAIRDGWLHTGDLGRRDAEGWFYVTGRLKDVIITGGENVSPAEVEEVLRAHPDVADVAVIGTPHPRWGEQVTAVVVPRPGASIDRQRLTAFAGDRLAGFKKPRRIEVVASLPRNAANKVQTSVLRRTFGA